MLGKGAFRRACALGGLGNGEGEGRGFDEGGVGKGDAGPGRPIGG